MTSEKMTLLSSLARKRKRDAEDCTSDLMYKRTLDVSAGRPQLLPNRQRISPFLNTPKQRKDEKRRLLRMSLAKLRDIDNAELCLHRAVVVHNTVKKLQNELRQEKFYHPPRSLRLQDNQLKTPRRLVRRRVRVTMNTMLSSDEESEDEDEMEEESPSHTPALVDHFALADLDSPMIDTSANGRVLQRTAMLEDEPDNEGEYTDIDTYKYTGTDKINYTDIDCFQQTEENEDDSEACPKRQCVETETVAVDVQPANIEVDNKVANELIMSSNNMLVEPPQCLIGHTGYFSLVSSEDSDSQHFTTPSHPALFSEPPENEALDLTPSSTATLTSTSSTSSSSPPSLVAPPVNSGLTAHTTCSEAYSREQSLLSGSTDSTFLSLLHQPWGNGGGDGVPAEGKHDIVDPVVGALMHVLASS